MRPLHSGICHECRVPYIWTKDSVLDSDNTSLQKMVPVRGVFYETEEVLSLVDGLERLFGISLQRIVFTAHKRIIRRFFEGTLGGVTGKLATALTPLTIYRQQAKVTPLFGVGTMSIEEYRRRSSVRVEARNVWNDRLFAADVTGAFEAVEGIEGDADSRWDGTVFKVTAGKSGDSPEEYRGRLVPLTGVLMGSGDYRKCPACGSPASFQVFEWNREKGEIRERDNGIRVVHQTIACIDSLLQEIEEELGEEVREVAVRSHADFVRERILAGSYQGVPLGSGSAIDRYRGYLGLIKRRCFGNPVRVLGGAGSLEVHIRNPANTELLMGRVLGTFEAVTGTGGNVKAGHYGGILHIDAVEE